MALQRPPPSPRPRRRASERNQRSVYEHCAVRGRRPTVQRNGIRARIMYMTVLSLADARASLSKHIESAATTHERFEITRNGARVAVLLSAEDYDALVETLDILSSPDEVAALRTAIAELESGDVSSADEVRAAMVARGRLTE